MPQKDKRIKNNVVSSLVYQVVLISLSFLLPRLYLENFGSAVNGVLSTVKQIFAYMCLLEMGVGLAATQALYKKIGKEDFPGASSVITATQKYYGRTGVIYLALVLVIAVVYGYIIPTGISSHVVFAIVVLNGLPSIFSYFVQAKYRILMEVDGRKYVINNSETVLQLLSNAGKVLVLVLTDSLILIQLVYCVIALGQLTFLYVYAKRRYKWLDLHSEPDFKSISQKNSALVHQISGMVFNNTDMILLSLMCDFTVVSVYHIYSIFFSQIQNFIASVISGFNFALGQMFNTDRERFDRIYGAYEPLYIMVTFIIYTLMAVFLLPLIQIYTGGINDADYSNTLLVILFVIMNLLANGKLPANAIIEYAGEFRSTRSHAVWEMVINLTVSVLAILKYGICGTIAGTIAALVYRSVVIIYHSNVKVLGRSQFCTYKCWLINGAVFGFVMAIFYVDTFSGVSFGKLLLSGIMHAPWIVALYIAVNFMVFGRQFRNFFEYCRRKNSL